MLIAMKRALPVLVAVAGAALLGGTVPAAAATKPRPVVVSITVKKGRVTDGTKRPTVKQGRVVRFVIRSDAGESVHLHGYELERKLVPGKALTLQFTARLKGRFELELHHPDVLLADLTVR